MPWKVYGKCVHKLNDDGSKGEVVKCHDSPAEAAAHVKALYANVKEEDSKTRTAAFAELISLSEAELDAEKHAARVTLISPGWSKNNRYYSRDVLTDAAHVFEGVKAYADHPSKSEIKDRPERSVRDLVGYYENVKVEKDGRLTADFKIRGAAQEWLWPLIATAVTEKPDLIGTSINALGKARPGEAEGRGPGELQPARARRRAQEQGPQGQKRGHRPPQDRRPQPER